MKNKYYLDTSAWVAYFAGTSDEIAQIVHEQTVVISVIVLSECIDVCRKHNVAVDDLLQFIKTKASIIPVTEHIAVQAALCKHTYRTAKNKFGLADGIHLATAQHEQAVMVTTDRDFAHVKDALVIKIRK